MPANGHGIKALGTLTTGNNLCIRRVEVTPRARHHSDFGSLHSVITVTMHQPHGHCLRNLVARQRTIFLCRLRHRHRLQGKVHRIGSFEDRVVHVHTKSIARQAEAEPVALDTQPTTYRLTLIGNGNYRAAEVIRKIFGIYHLGDTSVLLLILTRAQRLGGAINNGDIIIIRHLIVVFTAWNGFHGCEIRFQITLPRCHTLCLTFGYNSAVNVDHSKGLHISTSTDIEHFKTGLAHRHRCRQRKEHSQ